MARALPPTLRKDLDSRNLSVWQDIVALEGGRDWWSQIEDALRSKALQHFVLVVTPGALESAVVRREMRLARQEGKTVSPVRGPRPCDLSARAALVRPYLRSRHRPSSARCSCACWKARASRTACR